MVYDWGQCSVGCVWLAEHCSIPGRVLIYCEVSLHSTSVKEHNVSCDLLILYPVDNSDSLSVVEQSQQGIGFSGIPFIIPHLWLCGVSYALCLLPSLLQCGLEIFCHWVDPKEFYLSLGILLMWSYASLLWGFCSLFYLGCFALYPGIACLVYVHYGIACLASQASYWAGAL